MNKILHLFDEQFAKGYFKKKILPKFPEYQDIQEVKIKPYKKLVWESTYHAVIEFHTKFLHTDGKTDSWPIVCTAHSSEPRLNVYKALKYLWQSDFSGQDFAVPQPLFYSDHFRAVFYRAVVGNNLYHYIREKDFGMIETVLPLTARWLAKLHGLPAGKAPNFNPENSRVETVYPGKEHILERISGHYPQYYDAYKRIYGKIIESENRFLSNTAERWLVHGDAHPENFIYLGSGRMAAIDFADLSLGDFARDLGSFSQQMDFMCARKINDADYSEKLQKIFFGAYFGSSAEKDTPRLRERIRNYYDWTAMRTATHFLLKHDAEPERADKLISLLAY